MADSTAQKAEEGGAGVESTNAKPPLPARIIALLCGTAVLALLIIFQVIPIALIVIGAIYQEDCSANHALPKWVTYYGIILLIVFIVTIFLRISASRLNQEVTKLAFIIDFVLQIVAAVVHFYVFTLLWPVFFAEEPKCDSLFLWFTFIVLTLLTILGALKICCGFFAFKEYDAYVKEEEKKENN